RTYSDMVNHLVSTAAPAVAPNVASSLNTLTAALGISLQQWVANLPGVLKNATNSEEFDFLPLKGSVYATVPLTNKEFSEWKKVFVETLMVVRMSTAL
ncbi:hypothetical protein HDU93_004272, partial [Gonapodya sp. JEL0774]